MSLESLAPGEVYVQKLDFVSYDGLEDLPEVLLRMDAEEQSRLFRQPIDPLVLKSTNEVSLQTPIVHGIPPVSASVEEPLIFEHVVEDDGTVEVYEAWFNNEKIHWQTEGGPIQLSLDLEAGHNNLYLEITDDLGSPKEGVYNVWLGESRWRIPSWEDTIETEESKNSLSSPLLSI